MERLRLLAHCLIAYLLVGALLAVLAPEVLSQALGVFTVVGIAGSLFLAGADTVRWLTAKGQR